MSIIEEIRKEGLKYVIDNLNKVDAIYQAYVFESKNKKGSTSYYFWYELGTPFLIALLIIVPSIYFAIKFPLHLNNILLTGILLNLSFSIKDFFGIKEKLLKIIIRLILKIKPESFRLMLLEYYMSQQVTPERKDIIIKEFKTEDIIKFSNNGVIKNGFIYMIEEL